MNLITTVNYECFDKDTILAIQEFCKIDNIESLLTNKHSKKIVKDNDYKELSLNKLISCLSEKINAIKNNDIKQNISFRLKNIINFFDTQNIPIQYYDLLNTIINTNYNEKDKEKVLKLIKYLISNINKFCLIIKKYDVDIDPKKFEHNYNTVLKYLNEIIDTAWNYDISEITEDIDMEYFHEQGVYLSKKEINDLSKIKSKKINFIHIHKLFLNIIINLLDFNYINPLCDAKTNILSIKKSINKNDFIEIKNICYSVCLCIYLLNKYAIKN